MMQRQHFERPTSSKQEIPLLRKTMTVLLFVFIAIISGAVGAAVVTTLFPKVIYTNVAAPTPPTQSSDKRFVALTGEIGKHGATIIKGSRAGMPNGFINPDDFLTAAVIVTSDGWLMAPLFEREGGVAVIGSDFYAVGQIVVDHFSKATFVKINARNLDPVEFSRALPDLGQSAISYDTNASGMQRLQHSLVSQPRYLPVRNANDFVLASNQLDEFIQLHNDAPPQSNPFYFSFAGQLIGMAASVNGETVLIPARQLKVSLEQLLKGEKVIDLGIFYVDRSLSGAGQQGIVLYHPTRRAVLPGSLAARIGLRAGDVILAINGETINSRNSFSSLWRSKANDETIRLTILRGVEESVLEVKLKD